MTDGTYSKDISIGSINWSKNSSDYAKYRPGLPESWYGKLNELIKQKYGENYRNLPLNILDVGCGPGTVTLELANKYNKYNIMGVDISQSQIFYAKNRLKNDSKYCNIDKNKCLFYISSVEDMSNIIQNNSIDIIICAQCWPWFDSKKTFKEFKRIFNKNKGLLIIVQYSYIPALSEVANITEKLILSKEYNPTWKHANNNGLYPSQIRQMFAFDGGYPYFKFNELICFDYNQPFSILSWIGRVNACSAVHPLNEIQLKAFNTNLKTVLTNYFHKKFNEIPETFDIKRRIWMLVSSVNSIQHSKM